MTTKIPYIWDYETHLIKPGMPAPRLVCGSIANPEPDGEGKLYGREEALDRVEKLLKNETSGGHHIFYDLAVHAAERPRILPLIYYALDEGRLHCTKIRQMMIDNTIGQLKFEYNEETGEYKKQDYTLERLLMRHKGINIRAKKSGGKVWRLRFRELDGVPVSEYPEEASDYAIKDTIYDRDIWISQQVRDIEPELTEPPGFASQMRAAWALNLMGIHGVRTDPEMVALYKKELKTEFAEHVKVCQEYDFRRDGKTAKGISRDLKNIRRAIEKWYRDNKGEMKITEKGAVSTDREQLMGTDHPGLQAVAESVRTEKLLTTYIAALERGTEVPLNPNYNPIIETYRTSCSGGSKINKVPVGFNVQNLPRKGRVRECIIPRSGNVFAFCDYDTLEMRTLAQVCYSRKYDYANLRDSLIAGRDLHIDLAADMLGMTYDQAMAAFKSGDKGIAEARQFCKIGNYGFGGGMGPKAFVQYAKNMGGIEVSEDQAFALWKGFRAKWKEMIPYFDDASWLCDNEDRKAELVVFDLTGMTRGKVPYTAVCNGYFQHPAAIGAKNAVYQVSKECYIDSGSLLYGCRPWLFAHDEIGMEIPYKDFGPKRAHEAAMRLQQVMIEEMQKICPDVPIGATVAMARRWHKGAPPMFEKGLLMPVQPVGKKWEVC